MVHDRPLGVLDERLMRGNLYHPVWPYLQKRNEGNEKGATKRTTGFARVAFFFRICINMYVLQRRARRPMRRLVGWE